ncbi:MAG: hypothetical protein PUB18_00215 [bacterium]|nr:hypothetical protein [bacterium]
MKKIKTNNLVIGIVVVFVMISLVVVAMLLFGGKKESQKEKLSKSLEAMGTDFYENYYYPQIATTDEERKEFVKKYENMGIKINLDNLSRYNTSQNEERVKEFVNEETKEKCDQTNTRVIIYPKSPYKKESYELKVELVCGFDKEK